LDKNSLSSFSSFAPIHTLTELYISDNILTLVDGVSNLFPNLEILDVSRNQLNSFKDIFTLSKLVLAELFLAGNPVANSEGFVCQENCR
jgi:Leucine-rich repeat (LRR) protein